MNQSFLSNHLQTIYFYFQLTNPIGITLIDGLRPMNHFETPSPAH